MCVVVRRCPITKGTRDERSCAASIFNDLRRRNPAQNQRNTGNLSAKLDQYDGNVEFAFNGQKQRRTLSLQSRCPTNDTQTQCTKEGLKIPGSNWSVRVRVPPRLVCDQRTDSNLLSVLFSFGHMYLQYFKDRIQEDISYGIVEIDQSRVASGTFGNT